MPIIDAVVTAGGIPGPDEPLYPLTQGKSKALLPIGGRPMIQWVLDAVGDAETVRRVVVVGLTADEAALTCAKSLDFLPNQGGMIANIEAGVKWLMAQDPATTHALLVSSDIPTITPAMVDWIVNTSLTTNHEAYYCLISDTDMEKRFPGSKRSYFRLKEGRFAGGDMNLIHTGIVSHYHPGWHGIVAARKNVFKQASLVGLGTLLRLAFGQLTIAGAEQAAQRALKVNGRALMCPYAETGMDVDKPHQYEIVRRDLEARGVHA
jgi:CTP:molybdopterin cytidylyltransferase MocA